MLLQRKREKNKAFDGRDIEKAPNMTLICNKNCHSCAVLAHLSMFNPELYSVHVLHTKQGDYPALKQNDQVYRGIELERKLFENKGIMDVSEESLEKIANGNDHRNCACNQPDYTPSLMERVLDEDNDTCSLM
jgi:hypothetical protein